MSDDSADPRPSLPLTHIPLDPPPEGRSQRPSSEDDRIHADRHYFARIYGHWCYGQFVEVWYGWSFDDWGTSGIQLNSIDDLYEVDIAYLASREEATL